MQKAALIVIWIKEVMGVHKISPFLPLSQNCKNEFEKTKYNALRRTTKNKVAEQYHNDCRGGSAGKEERMEGDGWEDAQQSSFAWLLHHTSPPALHSLWDALLRMTPSSHISTSTALSVGCTPLHDSFFIHSLSFHLSCGGEDAHTTMFSELGVEEKNNEIQKNKIKEYKREKD